MRSVMAAMVAAVVVMAALVPGNARGALMGHWSFEVLTGADNNQVPDDSGRGHTVALEPGVADRPVQVPGASGMGLFFDGDNDAGWTGTHADFEFGTSQDFTITGWIQTTSSAFQTMVGKMDWFNNNRFQLGTHNGKLYGETAAAQTEVVSSATVNDGEWHHVAAVCDRDGDLTLYIDLGLDGQLPMAAADVTSGGRLCVGARTNGGSPYPDPYPNFAYFNGIIDEVRIYDEALNWGQLQQDYTLTSLPEPTSALLVLLGGLVLGLRRRR